MVIVPMYSSGLSSPIATFQCLGRLPVLRYLWTTATSGASVVGFGALFGAVSDTKRGALLISAEYSRRLSWPAPISTP